MTFPIPREALDDRLAIVGTAGSGKTYLALGAIEHLFARSARVIAIDPLGVMWGLRLCADGKASSPFQPVIFGGAHGDLPINEHAGALIGQAIATSPESCIIDLSQLGTKAAERRFMLSLLTALYRDTNKEPVHLIVDEADMFAPQQMLDKDGELPKLVGMMETIVRRGRVKGFIPWLITQRPAVLSKNVLSQADGIVALKLTAKQDHDALAGWITATADVAQWQTIKAALPTKQMGQGVVWIPARGILREATFPARATFDSSRTPKRGERLQAAALKPIDLGALKHKLATVEEETKQNDPRALKAEIARLTRELAAKPKAEGLDQSAVESITRLAAEAGIESVRQTVQEAIVPARGLVASAIEGAARDFAHVVDAAMAEEFGRLQSSIASVKPVKNIRAIAPPSSSGRTADFESAKRGSNPRGGTNAANGHDNLTTPQRRIMASLGFWKSIGHESPTRAQIAAVAGYSPGSGGFNNLIGGLNTAGLISIPSSGRVSLATDYGALTADEARDKMLSVLSAPQRRLLDAAIRHVRPMSREHLAEATEYSSGSGGFNNLIGSLCTLTIFEKPSAGHIAVSDWAREVLT